jgi:protein SCO1/2
VLSPELTLPELALRRVDGTPFSTADLQGKLALVYFGYTRCPDICPLTLVCVAQSRRLLAANGRSIDAYFITVDPERDTPARLREYLANFDPPVVGLTGTDAELAAGRQAFGVVAEKRSLPGSAADYTVDHTSLIFLVDGRGAQPRVRLVYPQGATPEAIAADVRRLLASPSA